MSELVLDFLTVLEEREARLLTWGFVDGGFEAAELELLGDEFALDHDDTGTVTGTDLIRRLRERALLLDVDDGTTVRLRTRMAETVRLLARLRQLFPKHREAGWSRAPTLVADYRLVTRSRAYPRRDVAVGDALNDFTETGMAEGDRLAALRSLLDGRGGDFRLSRFQADAVREILTGLDSRRSGGTIVGAGTGSGKTLAFYLPALSHVVSASSRAGTRALAIYPRIELLRDQFAEAYRESRRLDGVGGLGRPIRLGALYGGTPHDAKGALRLWKSRGSDRICPYLLCPSCSVGTLIWSRADIDASRHRLVCSACSAAVNGDQLVLTRRQMRETPPDILFTTTEMLNRVMMDDRMRHLVGAGPRGMPIDMVLLDEVHTYEGTTGAHVAGVLRRWRHARRGPVHFVGLSATLREASVFFAGLTGLGLHQVLAVEPHVDDLEYEGQEYMLAVRSDPHSGASVLSTTIQTAMLMQRALDPMSGAKSQGAFGQRLFAFTDDLDVTNRLFFDLLDAEGLNSWGNPEKPSLAALRGPIGADLPARRAAGQTWEALERIGHQLDEHAHMRIGRTTSQDADVDRAASAIVATASLEVGFNDTRVGAVIQHKSPHDTAAFLQRKGRAGRSRGMRPWTIAVLSDFGRDRTTYQSYERLFDPELAPRSLPIANPAVVRMQAVFATLDWLATKVDGGAQIWTLLQRPPGSSKWGQKDREKQERIADLLASILWSPEAREELTVHLKAALACDDGTLAEILWEPPRPLLATALPTAIRRLRTGWRHLELGSQGDHVGDGPLPEFVVSRLFGDLALPEIVVVTPSQNRHDEERREPMRAVQALNAYAPGRVSHRLTIAHRYARHWVEPSSVDADGQGQLEIQDFVSESEDLGVFAPGTERALRVVRPLAVEVSTPPSEVLSSSHGRLRWVAEIQPSADSEQVLQPPAASAVGPLIDKVVFFTHGGLAHVEVRRWAGGCDIERRTLSETTRGTLDFVDSRDGEPMGLGLAIDADAVAIDMRVPQALLSERDQSTEHLRGLRVERYRELLASSPVAQRVLGSFDAERLADGALVALLDEAIRRGTDLESTFDALREKDRLREAVAAALQRSQPDEGGEDAATRRTSALLAALDEGPILEAVSHAASALWEDIGPAWDTWAGARLAASVGAAFHVALQETCPEYDAGELVVDLERPPEDPGAARVWLSEQTVGGGGLLQEALRRIGDRPRRFFDLVEAACEPSVDETVDAEMRRIIRAAAADTPIADAIAMVREADSHGDRSQAFDGLLAVLEDAGVFVCQPVVSALSVRLLRPGSTARIDGAVAELIERWDEIERGLGVDVDLRAYAELQSRDDAFERASGLTAPGDDPVGWRVGQIMGVLWPHGSAVRVQGLRAPNPYSSLPAPDPLLLRSCLTGRRAALSLDRVSELGSQDGQLARAGDAEIQGDIHAGSDLRKALLRAAATPIEAGALLHYPRVDGVRRDGRGFRARLVLDLVGE